MYAGASRYFAGTRRAYIFMPERAASTRKTRVPVPGIKFFLPLAALFVLWHVLLVEIAGKCKMKPSLRYKGSINSIFYRFQNRSANNPEIAITLKSYFNEGLWLFIVQLQDDFKMRPVFPKCLCACHPSDSISLWQMCWWAEVSNDFRHDNSANSPIFLHHCLRGNSICNELHSHYPVDTRASAVPFRPLPGEMRLQHSLTYLHNWAKSLMMFMFWPISIGLKKNLG